MSPHEAFAPDGNIELTDRQREVIELIDRRMPIKVVAAELGISATRVNQHVRAMKDLYGANSLADLVRKFRERAGYEASPAKPQKTAPENPFTKDVLPKSKVQSGGFTVDESSRDDALEFAFSDALNFAVDPPWVTKSEPDIVPGMLDGRNFVTARFLAMVGGAVGIMSLFVLVLTSFMSLGVLFEGRAYVPEGNWSRAGEQSRAEITNDRSGQSGRLENSQADARS